MLPGNKWMKPPTKWLVIWKMLNNSEEQWYWLVWFSNTALANHSPQTKSDWPPIFANKVLLGHSHTAIHLYNLWLLWHYRQSWVVETEGLQPAKPNIFTSSSFREKKFDSCCSNPVLYWMRFKNRYYHPGLFEMQNLRFYSKTESESAL